MDRLCGAGGRGPYEGWHGANASPPPTSVLLEVVLALERLATGLTRECDVILVRPLVDHEVVGLGEATLAVLADKLALGSHLAPKLATVVRLDGHYGKHRRGGMASAGTHTEPLSREH